MIRKAHGIGVSVQINPSRAMQESTVASAKDKFCSKIFSQTLYFSSFSLLEIWTEWKYDSVEGSWEILLFFIEHCSCYCHINCFRFSVQIVFRCFLWFVVEHKFRIVVWVVVGRQVAIHRSSEKVKVLEPHRFACPVGHHFELRLGWFWSFRFLKCLPNEWNFESTGITKVYVASSGSRFGSF